MSVFEESKKEEYKFNEEEENYITKLRESVKKKADYDLRRVIGITKRLRDKVDTGTKDEFGDPIEDWDKLSTNDLINFFSEGSAWNFFSAPIKMQAFIESSLSEVVYKYEFNTILSSLTDGTVAQRNATAELQAQQNNFAALYKKMYADYITEVLRSFDGWLRRVERVINFRQMEERMTPNRNPF